jgi:hypothetical protein
MKKLNILIACEESQVITSAFREHGHTAFSCDILQTSGSSPEWHIKDDAIKVLYSRNWDLVIAHPPCTRISKVCLQWLYSRNLWDELKEATDFFNAFRDYGRAGNKIAIENPVPHRHALKLIGDRYSQIIHPWQHGHGDTKPTCLWLYNLPLLTPRLVTPGRYNRNRKMPGNKDRARLRSVTYSGIAKSMVEQWTRPEAYQMKLLY